MSPKTARKPHHSDTNEHPTVERLKAYHQGQLTESEEELVREHFISCSECRETFLELSDFLEGVSRESRWDPADLVREWRKIQAALRGENTSTEVAAEETLATRQS